MNDLRVLIAPDSFGDSLTAVQAAEAIAAGWRRARPGDTLTLAPQSDGGPGLRRRAGQQARWRADAAGERPADRGGVRGVGTRPGPARDRLHRMRAGVRAGAVGWSTDRADRVGRTQQGSGTAHRRGSGCPSRPDRRRAGRQQLHRRRPRHGRRTRRAGGRPQAAGRRRADRRHRRRAPTARADGSRDVFGPQKGADPETVLLLEQRLTDWAAELDAAAGREVSDEPGAGAAGGIGAALLALGGRRESGAAIIAEHTRLADDVGRRRTRHHRRGAVRRPVAARQGGQRACGRCAVAAISRCWCWPARSRSTKPTLARRASRRRRRSPTTPARCSWPSTTRQTSWLGCPSVTAAAWGQTRE